MGAGVWFQVFLSRRPTCREEGAIAINLGAGLQRLQLVVYVTATQKSSSSRDNQDAEYARRQRVCHKNGQDHCWGYALEAEAWVARSETFEVDAGHAS